MQATEIKSEVLARTARTVQRLESRLLHGLSRRKFARKSGVHVSAVARILRGERGLSMMAARRWAAAASMTIDEVLASLDKLRQATTAAKVTARRRRR